MNLSPTVDKFKTPCYYSRGFLIIMKNNIMEKHCESCDTNKSITEFRKNKKTPDGYMLICKFCTKERKLFNEKTSIVKQYRIDNAEIINQCKIDMNNTVKQYKNNVVSNIQQYKINDANKIKQYRKENAISIKQYQIESKLSIKQYRKENSNSIKQFISSH